MKTKKKPQIHTNTQSIMSLPYIFHIVCNVHFVILHLHSSSFSACWHAGMHNFSLVCQQFFFPLHFNCISYQQVSTIFHFPFRLSARFTYVSLHLFSFKMKRWWIDSFLFKWTRAHVHLSQIVFMLLSLCVAFSFCKSLCIYWSKWEICDFTYHALCRLKATWLNDWHNFVFRLQIILFLSLSLRLCNATINQKGKSMHRESGSIIDISTK